MGKFMNAKFNSECKQTGEKIKKGDSIYYVPGRGSFCKNSQAYQDHRENHSTAEHVRANEEAYFDNFYHRNYGSNNL
jgi:hypothetical protein